MSAPELRIFIRLIRKDLRFDAGSKIILDAISPTAYTTYQSTNDLEGIVKGEDIGEVCISFLNIFDKHFFIYSV